MNSCYELPLKFIIFFGSQVQGHIQGKKWKREMLSIKISFVTEATFINTV